MKFKIWIYLLPLIMMAVSQCKKDDGPTIRILRFQPVAEYGKDANIWSAYPDLNGGDSLVLRVLVEDDGGTASIERFLIEFDLSPISDKAEVILAELHLSYFDTQDRTHHSTTGPNVAFLKRITSAWDEQTVTWNNQPSTTSENQVVVPNSTSPTSDLLLDATVLVKDLITYREGSHGFMMQLEIEEGSKGQFYASSDHLNAGYHPWLEVTILE
jgi:hypothetical protein